MRGAASRTTGRAIGIVTSSTARTRAPPSIATAVFCGPAARNGRTAGGTRLGMVAKPCACPTRDHRATSRPSRKNCAASAARRSRRATGLGATGTAQTPCPSNVLRNTWSTTKAPPHARASAWILIAAQCSATPPPHGRCLHPCDSSDCSSCTTQEQCESAAATYNADDDSKCAWDAVSKDCVTVSDWTLLRTERDGEIGGAEGGTRNSGVRGQSVFS